MRDIFIEYLVEKQKTPHILLLKALIVLAAAAVPFVAALFGMAFHIPASLLLLLTLLAGYSAYRLITSMNIEYEYSITNGEMDADRIIARRTRKRLVNVDFRQVESFGRYRPMEHRRQGYETRIFICDTPRNPELWYCVARTQQGGRMLVVFNADQKTLDAIKLFLPPQIMREAFRSEYPGGSHLD